MVLSIAIFIFLATLIFVSGRQLSIYGDVIAEQLGLGKAWIGLVLMASVTSLPELTVGISSVTITQSANLALGDVIGSCVFNLFILSILDAFTPGESLFLKASSSHILAASMSIVLVALVGLALLLPPNIVISKWIGLSSIVFIAVYFFSMRMIYKYDKELAWKKKANDPSVTSSSGIPLKIAVIRYILNAVIVIGAALFLPDIANTIAEKTGLGQSFVATLFLAACTSLPELAVSFSALRLGSYDLAVGNLIGSNIFNILILAVDDIFYSKGYLLKDASDVNIVSAFSVIMMTAVAIAGLTYPTRKKKFILAWDSLLILLIYISNLSLLYYLKGRL